MQWSAFSRAPAAVQIQIDNQFTESGDFYEIDLDPYNGELSHEFPADTFAVDDPVVLELKAYDFYTFGADDPDFDVTSVFRIRLRSPNRTINTL